MRNFKLSNFTFYDNYEDTNVGAIEATITFADGQNSRILEWSSVDELSTDCDAHLRHHSDLSCDADDLSNDEIEKIWGEMNDFRKSYVKNV